MESDVRRSLGGFTCAILSFVFFSLAVLMALGEAGYHRTYGCFFPGNINIFDACGDGPATGLALFIVGELLLVSLALLCGFRAFRMLHPSREPSKRAGT